jgi:hypothetical protein
MSSHIFFCNETDCFNMTTYYGATCYDCCEAKLTREYPNCCPDCGDTGATMLGMDYCYPCWTKRRHGCPPQHYCMKCDSFFALKEGDDERPQCYKCTEWDEACAEQADLPIELPHCEREHVCSGEWDYDLGYRVCDNSDDEDCPQHEHTGRCGWSDDGTRICEEDDAEWDVWCGVDDEFPKTVRVSDELKAELLANLPTEGNKWSFTPAVRCTCDRVTGRMCQTCDEESSDPCRGCGSHSLWSDRYCLKCYEVRYGPINPVLPPLPPSPEPRHTSLESMRDEIAEIEVRIRGGLTKGQRDDWVWILQNRRADLAAAEKDMWDQYDQDDLRKLDLQCRR